MDVRMDHEKTKLIVDEKGWSGFIEHVNGYFVNYELYSCSQDWYDNSEYICKLRGTNGDVIIGWHGVHDY